MVYSSHFQIVNHRPQVTTSCSLYSSDFSLHNMPLSQRIYIFVVNKLRKLLIRQQLQCLNKSIFALKQSMQVTFTSSTALFMKAERLSQSLSDTKNYLETISTLKSINSTPPQPNDFVISSTDSDARTWAMTQEMPQQDLSPANSPAFLRSKQHLTTRRLFLAIPPNFVFKSVITPAQHRAQSNSVARKTLSHQMAWFQYLFLQVTSPASSLNHTTLFHSLPSHWASQQKSTSVLLATSSSTSHATTVHFALQMASIMIESLTVRLKETKERWHSVRRICVLMNE